MPIYQAKIILMDEKRKHCYLYTQIHKCLGFPSFKITAVTILFECKIHRK